MSRLSGRLSLAMLLLVSGVAGADIYKYVDKSGNVTYTDNPEHSGYRLLVRSPAAFSAPVKVYFGGGRHSALSLRPRSPKSLVRERNRQQYAGVIEDAANQHGLDPGLLHAVIQAESGYNPGAVSHKGAVGLMQLMPGTAARYGVDPYNPEENILGGARYLSDLMGMFGSNVSLAVAAYNAGENNVIKYGNKIPPFSETQNYVSKVLANYNRQY
ncbi:lytic transglycosylase domain-containing protein [Methylomagnum sp.]